jgi:DNA-binding CsgD family transcriptional regulator
MRNHQMIQRTGAHVDELAMRRCAESLRKKLNSVPVKRTLNHGINGFVAAINLRRERGVGYDSNSSGRLTDRSGVLFTSRNKTTGTESMACRSISKEPSRTTPPVGEELGLLLMDSSLNPISWNDEAVRILSYPEVPQDVKCLRAFLTRTIQDSQLIYQSTPYSPRFVTEFVSGRRRYRARLFYLHRHQTGPSASVEIELVLERSAPEFPTLSLIASQFNISRRERQAVEWLLQGLSSKEIADRMKISSHTVNSFIRTIMIKMGVSNRSGILGKMITANFTRNSVTPQEPDSASID